MCVQQLSREFRHVIEQGRAVVAFNRPAQVFVYQRSTGARLAVYVGPDAAQQARAYCEQWERCYN